MLDGQARWQTLLELVGLVVVLDGQGIEVLLASDFELGSAGLLALLDARRWRVYS